MENKNSKNVNKECSLKIEQGGIYLIDFGEYKKHVKGGVRPGVVLSSNCENKKASQILVAPLTSIKQKHEKRKYRNDVYVEPSDLNGLHSKSVVHSGNIQSIDKVDFKHKIGKLEDNKQVSMIKGLMYTLGLPYLMA